MNVILSSDILKQVVKGIKLLVGESVFRFDGEGMNTKAVDPANVGMVITSVPKESFEAYNVKDDGEVLGVDINRIHDITKGLKSGELVEMWSDDSQLYLRAGNLTYSVSVIDPKAIRKEPKVPHLDLPAKIVFPAGDFKKAMNACDKVAETARFISNGSFYIESEGDVDKLRYGIDEVIEHNKGEGNSLFSIEYLKEFAKAGDKDDPLTILLGNNYPVWLKYGVAGAKASVEYILAPRIEEDE